MFISFVVLVVGQITASQKCVCPNAQGLGKFCYLGKGTEVAGGIKILRWLTLSGKDYSGLSAWV